MAVHQVQWGKNLPSFHVMAVIMIEFSGLYKFSTSSFLVKTPIVKRVSCWFLVLLVFGSKSNLFS
jgi:hypothetical protein